ncbi:hypothetical protein BHE74_00017047 [Ensete ventricosum]|nr:hypothetical protein BHE74_00017047 [Ensete ventricosum]
MADVDLSATSLRPRTIGPSMWPTRRGKPVGCRYRDVSGRIANLTHVRSTPLTCRRTPHRKDDRHGGEVRRHAPPATEPPSANRGSNDSRADSKPFLENDDRPGVSFTRIQPCAVRGHGRGFPRPHQPSPSTSGYGVDHSPVPTPAHAFDSSPISSPDGTPANGVTSSPKLEGPARGGAAIAPVCRVHQQLDEVQKEVLKSRGEVGESSKGSSSFTPEIQAKPLPATFRLPALEPYDGSDDPTEHIAAFRTQMALYDTSDVLICRAFPTTLRGPARIRYSRLKPASISLFDLLAKEFELNFLASARPKSTTACLLGMAQGSDEPFSKFVGRFTSHVWGIPYLHPSLAIQAFLAGLRPSRFLWLLIERPPATLPEMLQRAHQYMTVETLVAGKWDETKRPRVEQPHGHPVPPPKRREDRSGLLLARPPNSPQFNSNRDLLSDPGEGSLEGLEPNEVTPRAARQKKVLPLSQGVRT